MDILEPKEAALSYLSKGLTVIPIRGRYANGDRGEAKRPLVTWQKWQGKKPTPAVIEGWFLQRPLADIGLLTGPDNGLLILDIDGAIGNESVKDYALPVTWTSLTRRGRHYMFRWDSRLSSFPTTKVGILPGVDIRGAGGYVVAPPSVGIGDFQYQWEEGHSPSEVDLANPPQWLIDLLTPKPSTQVHNAPSFMELREGVAEGENRHQAMTRISSVYMSRGVPVDDVIVLMKAWNERCEPPRDEDEFEADLLKFLKNWTSGRYKSNYQNPQAASFDLKRSDDFVNSGDKSVNWLVQGLIPVETIGFLHGYGGLGKSWMTLDLGIEIGRGGGMWLGKFLTKSGRVLYIDEESHPTMLRQRYTRLLNAKGLSAKDVDMSFLSLPNLKFDNPASLDAFKGLLVELQPTLIIYDPFVSCHSMNENASQDMARLRDIFKGLIRDCKAGLFLIDHDNKPGEVQKQAAQRQRGSSEKDAVADVKVAISNKGGQLIVEHSKSRYGIAVPEFGLEIVDTGEAATAVRWKVITTNE